MTLIARRRLIVSGAVQGVGFRPFVYSLARSLGLAGTVANTPQGATVEIEGTISALDRFEQQLATDLPAPGRIDTMIRVELPVSGAAEFIITDSCVEGALTAEVLPDLATCDECLRELFDPNDRRYRYPFLNCTHCGPRVTIITSLPYDRANTTMREFALCPKCNAEYHDPADRRFHAQPIACPHCGPQLTLVIDRKPVAVRDNALRQAEAVLRSGGIVALKGIGGYQLLCDARDGRAIQRLRDRKNRPHKPLAVMFPTLQAVETACDVSPEARALLTSRQAPIVLLNSRRMLPDEIAPGLDTIGAMLPYTPLHHLLLADLAFPVVCTSGNVSGAPMIVDDAEALDEFAVIADAVLLHNRPIATPVDDSVVTVVNGEPLMLRRARGYSQAIVMKSPAPENGTLAVGPNQKVTVALCHNGAVSLSPHLGDADDLRTQRAIAAAVERLTTFHRTPPARVVRDLHPDYATSHMAQRYGLPTQQVQHHAAHVYAVLAETGYSGRALGLAWDGTGCGPDGTIWGSEAFRVVPGQPMEHVAQLAPFPLPGGDAAAREPRRSALGVLWSAFDGAPPVDALHFTESELRVLLRAIDRGVNSPRCTSMGRLFDAAASLLGLAQRCSFEGQAAMLLEAAARSHSTEEYYPYQVTYFTVGRRPSRWIMEWKSIVRGIMSDSRALPAGEAAAKFHNTLAEMVVSLARAVNEPTVILSGGCFQNKLLLERTTMRLKASGFEVLWPRVLPPNDGAIAIGQLAAAACGDVSLSVRSTAGDALLP